MLFFSETVAVPSTPPYTRPKHPSRHQNPDIPHLEIDPKCLSLCLSSIWTTTDAYGRIRTVTLIFAEENRPRDLGNEDLNLD
jgi:hypothetical protein